MGAFRRDGPAFRKEGHMAWLVLFAAGLFEVLWAFAMKQSDGFTRLWPTVWTGVGTVASVGLLSISMKTLPLGTAYMVWTGIGAVGAFAVGVVWLGESLSPLRIGAALLIIAGLLLMKLAGE
jgi:quaternary ammonium compound-resistance protein SugE